jgi:hypothetical protein
MRPSGSLDIMTSEGSAAPRFHTRVSVPAARAASCTIPRTIHHELGGQPCARLARLLSAWTSTQTRWPWLTSGSLAGARVTLTTSPARSKPRPTIWSVSLKRVPVAPGFRGL